MTRHDTPLTGLRNKDRDTTVSSGPKGMGFVRAAIALAIAEKDRKNAKDIATKRWGDKVARMLETKADVPAGSVVTGGWGSQLVSAEAQGMAAEFYGVVASRSILGRIPNLRKVPPYRAIIRGASVGTGWVGEGEGLGLSSIAYQRTAALDPSMIQSMVCVTDELLRDSSPDAESVIREEMIRAMAVAMDDAFVNPANAGTIRDSDGAVVKPMSITRMTTEATSGDSPEGTETGTVPEQATDAMDALLASFTGELENAVLVMQPKLAAQICSTNRPNIGATGGSWAGIPVITSSNAPTGVIILLDPAGLAVCLPQEGAEIKISTHGTIQMQEIPIESAEAFPFQFSGEDSVQSGGDSPGAKGPIATQMVSLFQTNTIAILAQRVANWRVVRPGSVAWVSGLSY
jgi:hypothetical protein